MRKFTLASLLLTTILLANFSFAQTCDSTCTKDQIQFHLVNDYSVSYLKMLSPTSGLRFKMDLGLNGSSGDNDVAYKNIFSSNLQQTNIRNSSEESSSNSQYVNFVANYVVFNKLANEVYGYWGAGPLLSFSHFSSKSNANSTDINSYRTEYYINESEYSESSFGLGLQVVCGVEVKFTEKFSFLAEFNLNGTYSWNKYSTTSQSQSLSLSESEHTRNGTSWNYGLNQLKLGIAYRF